MFNKVSVLMSDSTFPYQSPFVILSHLVSLG